MVHGITQHAASLSVMANVLATNGFIVYGIDLRGHGWWHYHNDRKGKGYYCDFKRSVKDVDQLLSLLNDEYPDLPRFIVGESAGAGVALRSASGAPDLVNGLVLVAAGSKAGKAKISWLVSDVAKNFYRRNHQINITRYQRRYGTDDLASLEESFKDPCQRPTMSLRELLGTTLFVRGNEKYARRLDPNCSVFVVQGEEDQVLTPKSARRVFARVPCRNKEMLVVPDCGHIIIGTNHVKPVVSQSITTWLERNSLPGQLATTVKRPPTPTNQLPTPTNQVAAVDSAIVH
jgi:alpha-beta hydrolase superfamily lysophospholipase